jgi:hypothetical protein
MQNMSFKEIVNTNLSWQSDKRPNRGERVVGDPGMNGLQVNAEVLLFGRLVVAEPAVESLGRFSRRLLLLLLLLLLLHLGRLLQMQLQLRWGLRLLWERSQVKGHRRSGLAHHRRGHRLLLVSHPDPVLQVRNHGRWVEADAHWRRQLLLLQMLAMLVLGVEGSVRLVFVHALNVLGEVKFSG